MTSRPNSDRRRRYRRQLAARDGAYCFYCDRRFRDLSDATLDHLVPVYYGGTWARANLVLACEPCNHAKGHRMPTEFLRSRGFRPGLRPSRTTALRRSATRLLARPVPARPAARPRPAGPLRTVMSAVPVLLAVGWTITRH